MSNEEGQEENEGDAAAASKGDSVVITSESSAAAKTAKRAKTRYEIADDWVALIQADEVNGATWREILEKEYEKKLDFTDNIEYHFTCPVCQSLPTKPITTSCKHNMCKLCLTHAMKASEKKECLMCRAPLEEEVEAEFDDDDDDAMDDDDAKEMKGVKKNYSRNMDFQATLVTIFPRYDCYIFVYIV